MLTLKQINKVFGGVKCQSKFEALVFGNRLAKFTESLELPYPRDDYELIFQFDDESDSPLLEIWADGFGENITEIFTQSLDGDNHFPSIQTLEIVTGVCQPIPIYPFNKILTK